MLFVEGFGVCAILLLGNSFRWWSKVASTRTLRREKLLRSPGESLRRNLEQLNEYLIYSVAIFLLVPMVFAWQAPILTNIWAVLFLIGLMALCALPGLMVVRLHRSYTLGLRAERAVGEEINQIMLDGCHVFHDYPACKNTTINHIVVAPSGVYAIETRTRPKKSGPEGDEQYEVIFDGKVLQFADFATAEPIKEARGAARNLERQLTGAMGEAIEVQPVITLPGWQIRDRGTSDVMVLNAKEIWQRIVTPAPPKLSAEQMKRIAYHIRQKCSDVEI
jgi:hypothetical protein